MVVIKGGKMKEEIKEDLMFAEDLSAPLFKKASGNICKTKRSIAAIVLGLSLFKVTFLQPTRI